MPTRNNTEGKVFGDIEGQTNHPEGLDMTKQLKMREGQRSGLVRMGVPKSIVRASINQAQFKPTRKGK